jgi:thiamine biosynthesis lipoprotein ApbE
VANGIVSVSAILSLDAGEHAGALADLASTSVFVLGPAKGLNYLGAQSTEGVIIVEKDGHLSASVTPGLRRRLQVTTSEIAFPDLSK